MNAMTAAALYADTARYQSELDQAEDFDRLLADLRAIPSFVDEALGQFHHGRKTYVDSMVERIAEGGDVQSVIDMALEAYAEKQRKANRFKDDAEIVAEWLAHQERKERLA